MAEFSRPHPPPMPRKSARGFTLVEVLVALAVLAIALAAVMHAMGQAIDTSTGLRDRTLALWVAQERATKYQMEHAWPAVDTSDGTTEFAGREWRWQDRVSSTPVPELRRIDIEIRASANSNVLASLAIFLQQP